MLGINYCMEGNYKHRVVDALLERKLLGKGAVLVDEKVGNQLTEFKQQIELRNNKT